MGAFDYFFFIKHLLNNDFRGLIQYKEVGNFKKTVNNARVGCRCMFRQSGTKEKVLGKEGNRKQKSRQKSSINCYFPTWLSSRASGSSFFHLPQLQLDNILRSSITKHSGEHSEEWHGHLQLDRMLGTIQRILSTSNGKSLPWAPPLPSTDSRPQEQSVFQLLSLSPVTHGLMPRPLFFLGAPGFLL